MAISQCLPSLKLGRLHFALLCVLGIVGAFPQSQAALLAYEPFTNAPGTAIIGSIDGYGFDGAWQSNNSSGTATNTGYGLRYTDSAGHQLVTSGGAGFFQGLTTANTSMQPNRLFNFTRATNGEAATTWISLLIVRQGPTNGTLGNPYARGVNVTFDYPNSSSGANQRLGVGNSSGAATNTVGILSGGGNLRPSTNPPYQFGGGPGPFPPLTNFVVLRVDHIAGTPQQANDNAYLWVNPNLAVEPALGTATTNVLGLFDYSIALVRVFVGGQDTANNRPYGEAVVDELRVGETFADVTPYTSSNPPVAAGPIIITNATLTAYGIVLSGTGGSNGGAYCVLSTTDPTLPATNWPAISTNLFDANGNFNCTNPVSPADDRRYYRLRAGAQIAPPSAPSITTQPQSLTVAVGGNAAFAVDASGAPPLSYQWYFNTNSPLGGATSASLAVNNAQTSNSGSYSVIVTNSAGTVTSVAATLTVLVPPAISTPPTNLTVTAGQNASFGVLASGDALLAYQWFFNTNTVLVNATNATFTVINAQGTNAGGYSVRVTNNVGSVTSVTAALTVNVPPAISSQPTNRSVTVSLPAAFSVAATGTTPLRYQWYFNTNTPLLNATNATFSIASVQASDAGGYSVRVTNIVGAVTSVVATLAASQSPLITTPPASQSVVVSNNATFTVTASGEAPLKYQWYFNTNTVLANATNASLTITNAQTNQAGGYSVIVTNNFGTATSSIATLTVNPALVAGAYFVSVTNGSDTNPGTEGSPFKTISKGLSVIGSGGVVYVRAGTYALSSKLSLSGTGGSATNMKRLWAYPGEFPLIDSTGNSSDGIGISGDFYYLKGLTVTKAGHNGINISGDSNIVEYCSTVANGNTGLHLTGNPPGPSYNLILNCDSYLNYDPPIGGNADGFSAKWDIGPGNIFRGCRAWWNSDDGWDLWMGTSPVLIDHCWAFWNGTNYWADPQFNGNGNGFKLGGNYVGTPHRLAHSLAFMNESNGVDQNNNEEGQTIDNNTGWGNKARNFNLNHGTNSNPHIVRNNLSFSGASGDSWRSGTIFTSNNWQVISSPAANASDVQSVSPSGVNGARQADGSLPVLPFLRPVSGGRLIDQGVDVGDPFAGTAPDLGGFEDGL